MLFLTMEDATGLVEAVVFPDVYRKMRVDLDRREPLMVTGKVENHYGAMTLVADCVLTVPRGEGPEPPGEGDAGEDALGSCAAWRGG